MTNSIGAATARAAEPTTSQVGLTIDEMRADQRFATENLLRIMERQAQALNERIEVVRQLLIDQGAATGSQTSTARIMEQFGLTDSLSRLQAAVAQETLSEALEPTDGYLTTELFKERAMDYLAINGSSKASVVARECGASPSSATVRMQWLRDKGLVRQNRKTKLWSAR